MWRGRTSKSHKKEIMSLLSFHSFDMDRVVGKGQVQGRSQGDKTDEVSPNKYSWEASSINVSVKKKCIKK